jgi:adenosylcobinamide kinase/adenosylcobinamide-phosphate guanylyltransferase
LQSARDDSGQPPVTLVLGGARSGKSRFAESLLAGSASTLYIATAEARDTEMQDRIAGHKARREARWRTIDAPLDVVSALDEAARAKTPALLDCLTLWLSNLMEAGRDIAAETQALTDSLACAAAPVVVVSNEVGQGIVPANALARRFRDEAGTLNQAVAAAATQVYFVTAGIPARLK